MPGKDNYGNVEHMDDVQAVVWLRVRFGKKTCTCEFFKCIFKLTLCRPNYHEESPVSIQVFQYMPGSGGSLWPTSEYCQVPHVRESNNCFIINSKEPTREPQRPGIFDHALKREKNFECNTHCQICYVYIFYVQHHLTLDVFLTNILSSKRHWSSVCPQ